MPTLEEGSMMINEAEAGLAIGEAQSAIEEVLNALEAKLGRPVERLELERVEGRSLASPVRQVVRFVRIEMEPTPGRIGRG